MFQSASIPLVPPGSVLLGINPTYPGNIQRVPGCAGSKTHLYSVPLSVHVFFITAYWQQEIHWQGVAKLVHTYDPAKIVECVKTGNANIG